MFKLFRIRVKDSHSIWHTVELHFKVLSLFSVQFPPHFFHSFHSFPLPNPFGSTRLKETTLYCRSEIVRAANKTRFSNPKDHTRLRWKKRASGQRSNHSGGKGVAETDIFQVGERQRPGEVGKESFSPSFLEWRVSHCSLACRSPAIPQFSHQKRRNSYNCVGIGHERKTWPLYLGETEHKQLRISF